MVQPTEVGQQGAIGDGLVTDDQAIMRAALGRYLDDLRANRRNHSDAHWAAWDRGVWTAFAQELGVLAVSFAEDHGGLGGGIAENLIVMEELGRALLGEPYLSTVVLCGGLLQRSGAATASEIIPRIIAGEAILAFAGTEPEGRYNFASVRTVARPTEDGYVLHGRKSVVYAAPWATHYMVTARTAGSNTTPEGISVFLLEAASPGIHRRDFQTIDGPAASELSFEHVRVGSDSLIGAEGAAWPLLERSIDEATVALCAEATGVLGQLNEETLEYARQRRQFGRPIAEFQVLQHRMVDMYVERQQAVSITEMAALTLDASPVERRRAVSAAKFRVGQACRFIGQSAIQIHGGIGTTMELPVSRYFKYATAFERRLGSSDQHLCRYASLMREQKP